MKKLICVLLAAVMCLGLCACATEEQTAVEEASAMMEQGQYEEAIARLSSVESYAQIAGMIEEAEQKIAEEERKLELEQAAFVYGTWLDLNYENRFTFHEDGTVTMEGESFTEPFTDEFMYDNGDIITPFGQFAVSEVDGITHLSDEYTDLVREADYAVVGPRDVEITMDNWEQYFELREATDVYINDFGEVESRSFGYGIFLRDEYMEKLVEFGTLDVSFELQYDLEYHIVTGDFQSGELEITDEKPKWWDDQLGETQISSVNDYRNWEDCPEESDFHDAVAAGFTGGSIWKGEAEEEMILGVSKNPQVLRVTGTMRMFP